MNLPATTTPTTLARSQVYFAQDAGSLRVKIGYSTNLGARLAGIETAAGVSLNLIRSLDGGPATERWIHRRFAAQRLIGEWFSYHPDMLSIVPPDEVIRPQKIVVRRDVRLTIRERLRGTEKFDLPARHALLSFVTDLTDDEAGAIMALIREHY